MKLNEQNAEMFAPVDRTGWPAGPWDGEPDREEWRAHGLACLATRHPYHGNWCGYVAVPPGHPLHGMPYRGLGLEAHGGVNFSEPCNGHVCHVPAPGEPDDVWWFGFDCGHGYIDIMPGMLAMYEKLGLVASGSPTYKDLNFVRGQVERLAEQLAASS